jgi:hypothetical protein
VELKYLSVLLPEAKALRVGMLATKYSLGIAIVTVQS